MNIKKKLLAIAVASATAGAMTGPTVAFAAGPTLYGQAHVSLDYFDNDSNKSLDASSNISRIGVKGSQDLGNGLAAIYLMEWQVNMTDTDAGTNTLSARNRYAGLKSDSLGTLVVGRHDTPVKVIGRKVDLFWSSQMGNNRNITAINNGDVRSDNVIGYITPAFGPVHAFLAYVTDTDVFGSSTLITDNANKNKALSGALIYDQNNLFLAAGWQRIEIDNNAAANNNTASPFTDQTSQARASARYDLGNWTFAAFYERDFDVIRTAIPNPGGGTTYVLPGSVQGVTGPTGAVDSDDQNLAGGGIAYKMGKNTFKGAAYWAGETDKGDNDGGWLYSAGVDHNFTKTVALYVTGAWMDNDNTGTMKLGGSLAGHGDEAFPGDPGDRVWSVSTGMRIKF
jgi:predicted porin